MANILASGVHSDDVEIVVACTMKKRLNRAKSA